MGGNNNCLSWEQMSTTWVKVYGIARLFTNRELREAELLRDNQRKLNN